MTHHRSLAEVGLCLTILQGQADPTPSVRIVALPLRGSSNNQRGRLRGQQWDIPRSERKQY